MTTKERFIEYLKFKGLGQTAFEESAGLSRGSIAKKTGFNADSIEKIATACPDLNINWLVTGLGEMLSHSNDEEEPQISYTQGVPYYNVDFIGGFDLALNDQTINPEYLIDFQKYNNADCWCNVTGHSMEPEINHGDIIA